MQYGGGGGHRFMKVFDKKNGIFWTMASLNTKIAIVVMFPLNGQTSQELRMLSSVTLNCQATKIAMNACSQMSEFWLVSQMSQVSGIVYVIFFVLSLYLSLYFVGQDSGHVPSSLWLNVSKITSL